MLATIGTFQVADETASGGYALSELRLSVQRIFDIVIPLETTNPKFFDIDCRRTVADFEVARLHASPQAADEYCALHDTTVPSTGDVSFTATDGTTAFIIGAVLITHQRVGGIGKVTRHAYHIEGGRIESSLPPVETFFRLLEDGSYRLLEDGNKRLLEH